MKRLSTLMLAIFLLANGISGVFAAQLSWDAKEFMGVDELAPGMTGYGKTVYQGTKVESFGVEVVGVLKKVDFGFDMILIKVTSGPVVDRKLQTVSGMSGSPIYINDRLIGAYAYGWDFQQEPIAGVTPIAAMLESAQPGSSTAIGTLVPANKVLQIGEHLISQVKIAANHSEAELLQAKANPTTMVLSPVASPLFVSGMSDAAFKPLQRFFDRYNLRAMPGPGKMDGPVGTLEPGSAVAVSLMEGDVNVSAIGTVTYVKGDTVLAFGHPFLGVGKVDLPMSTAYVQGIVNSSQSSFKMASPVARVGALYSDRQFSVAGKLGQAPKTLPITMRLSDSSRDLNRYYTADVVHDPLFTPALLYMYSLYRGASTLADFTEAEGTFNARTVLSTDKFGDIEQRMTISPLYSPMTKVGDSAVPMGEFYLLADSLMENPYEPVGITKAFIELTYQPGKNIAVIEKIIPDRTVVRAGDTVNMSMKIRPYGKPVETKVIRVTVPKDISDSVMLVLMAGGGNGMILTQILAPPPTDEEGIKGIIRWLSTSPPAESLVTAQVYPSMSYAYHGRIIETIPNPVLDLLHYSDAAGARNEGEASDGNPRIRPLIAESHEPVPYILLGGLIVKLAIDQPEQKTNSNAGNISAELQMPVLSTTVTANPSASDEEEERTSWYATANWFSAQQRARHAAVIGTEPSETTTTAAMSRFAPPQYQPFFAGRSLSSLFKQDNDPSIPGKTLEEQNEDATDNEETITKPADEDNSDEAVEDEDWASDEDEDEDEPDTSLLTGKLPTWGLKNRNDFLHGRHAGTTVTSQGRLVLAPFVRSIYQTTEMLPWKVVVTDTGTYIIGWNSTQVIKLDDGDHSEVIFPRQAADAGKAETLTALAADANGNLLVASWPDQRVRSLDPNGALLREWSLPGNVIWALAVTTDGKRYAACDKGIVYLLRDDLEVPLQVGCTVPDTNVSTLAVGPRGDLYLATSPRGKIYRLSADGQLSAVAEIKDQVSSMAVDQEGILYVGTSPSCSVFRITPDGNSKKIMTGTGRGNHHVMGLVLDGNTLYAATAPSGGIYKISGLTEQEPEVTAVFAREDLRVGDDEDAGTGSESVLVTSLAITPSRRLIATASSPGQVLRIEPRETGVYISPVLSTPAVSRWGQVETHISINDPALKVLPPNVLTEWLQDENNPHGEPITIETRSGLTAWPDTTWSQWAPVSAGTFITSPPATNAQMRVTIHDPQLNTSLDFVRASYLPANRTPMVKLIQPKTGEFISGKQKIKWEGTDPDKDKLVYTVALTWDNGVRWAQMIMKQDDEEIEQDEKDEGESTDKPGEPTVTKAPADDAKKAEAEAEQKPDASDDRALDKTQFETGASLYTWDTKAFPDGQYLIRVTASDKYARPLDFQTATVISRIFTVDNTPPKTALSEKVDGWGHAKRFTITDNISPIVGGKFRIDDGPWTALTPEDGIFDSKEEVVALYSPDGPITLSDGEHTLEIVAKDAADNELTQEVTIQIGDPPPAAKKK